MLCLHKMRLFSVFYGRSYWLMVMLHDWRLFLQRILLYQGLQPDYRYHQQIATVAWVAVHLTTTGCRYVRCHPCASGHGTSCILYAFWSGVDELLIMNMLVKNSIRLHSTLSALTKWSCSKYSAYSARYLSRAPASRPLNNACFATFIIMALKTSILLYTFVDLASHLQSTHAC